MAFKRLKEKMRHKKLQKNGISKDANYPVVHFGARSGVWPVVCDSINSSSVIYSFGVGDNIVWDLALIEQFDVMVHAFDPTPASIAWVKQQTLPNQFIFHEYGLAGEDGSLTFFPPKKEGRYNYSSVDERTQYAKERVITAPVFRLSTIMQQLSHTHIDILKMDIEGNEYDVIDEILDKNINVQQILVEFHHMFPNIEFETTKATIEKLRHAGYKIFDISARGYEFAFIRES